MPHQNCPSLVVVALYVSNTPVLGFSVMRAGPNPMTREIVGSAPCYHGDGGGGAVGGSAQGWEAGNGAAVCVCSRRWGLVAGACGPDHCGDWWHRPRELAYLLRSLIKLSPPLPPGGPPDPQTAKNGRFPTFSGAQCATVRAFCARRPLLLENRSF